MASLLLIALVLTLVTLSQVVDLRRQDEVRLLMDGVLTHRGQATLDEVALLVREQKHYLGRHVAQAHAARHAGDHAAAKASLCAGTATVAELAPGFLSALRRLRRLARCVAAIVVVDPISAHAFRTPHLKGVAAAGVLVHYLLLTGRQRVVLRLHVVGAAFRFALRQLSATTACLATGCTSTSWRRVDELVADLGSSGDEALVATRQIAEALDAVEFGGLLAPRRRT